MHKHGLRIWDRVFGWKRRAEAKATLDHARDFLPVGCSVLDIGCGIGYALDVLENEFACVAHGCDVVVPPNPIPRFALFDGSRLPYADKSFDAAFLIFVLHHAEDPGIVLREAARVARSAVVVVEDTPQLAFDRKWGEVHVRSFNKRHGIPWCGRVRDEREWRQIFQFSDLRVLHAEKLGRLERLPPVSRTCFVLGPSSAAQEATASASRLATS
jgi:SAM-dependent methyltransferase